MLALLLSTGLVLADDCPVEPLQVVGGAPSNHATGVPLDARILALLGDGHGDADEWALTLDWAEGSFPGTTTSWCHPDRGPEHTGCVIAFQPAEPLPSDTDFNVLLDTTSSWQGDGDDREVFYFATGSGAAVSVDGQPRVDVVSAMDLDPDCGWDAGRSWELTLTSASGDFHGLSLFYVYGVDSDDTTRHLATRAVPAAGSLASVTVARDAADPWTDCFVVVQEDALGQRSPASDIDCLRDPLDTAADTGTSGLDAGGCGCAQSPGSAPVGALGLLVGLAWSRRRRAPRC